ncbi:hypothetical protein [Metabacillus malikii]|uniref:Uncharacterized protein n=1 Tax=Metabacillus malikii TaxID=1504265 RepID=A0ABT9ZGC0_9BACI|nr:hypothetical protein [Metabacillus malikii]MDQ0231327.1 hypothetical protein [Metabacillus malikii]
MVGWLSKKDGHISKAILFGIFFYLAYLIAFKLLKTRRKAFAVSIVSLFCFMLGRELYNYIFV